MRPMTEPHLFKPLVAAGITFSYVCALCNDRINSPIHLRKLSDEDELFLKRIERGEFNKEIS